MAIREGDTVVVGDSFHDYWPPGPRKGARGTVKTVVAYPRPGQSPIEVALAGGRMYWFMPRELDVIDRAEAENTQ